MTSEIWVGQSFPCLIISFSCSLDIAGLKLSRETHLRNSLGWLGLACGNVHEDIFLIVDCCGKAYPLWEVMPSADQSELSKKAVYASVGESWPVSNFSPV